MTTLTVQDCGCIAIPEEIQQRTGLFPRASFEVNVSDDSSTVTLKIVRRGDPTKTVAACAVAGNLSGQ